MNHTSHALFRFSALTLCLAAPGYLAAQAPLFTIQDLGSLPNLPACNATAISPSGTYVTGFCASQIGLSLLSSPATHAFVYSSGVMKDLNATAQSTPFATAVNDSGVVAGGYFLLDPVDETASTNGFIYENGSLQSLPGQLQGVLPFSLNNTGQYVGSRFEIGASNLNFFITSAAYLDQVPSGTATLLQPTGGGAGVAFGINATGAVAGAAIAQNAGNVTPFLWVNALPQSLPILSGYLQSAANAINDSGVAAGDAFNLDFSVLVDPTAAAHAVLFSNGGVTDLGVLPGDLSSEALGINNSGWVVGFSDSSRPTIALQLAAILYAPVSHYHAFLYANGQMYNLNNLLVNGTGWNLSFATAVNNAGQIVGTGFFEDSNGNTVQRGFLLTPYAGPLITSVEGGAFSTPKVTSISPNGFFTIFGNQLAAAPTFLTQSDIVNNQLPTNLGGTCVEGNGTMWELSYVAPGQVNVLAGPLPTSGVVPVSVITGCGTANEVSTPVVNVAVAPTAPEFLYFLETANGQNPIAVTEPSGAYVGTPGLIAGANFAPANVGDTLTAYGVGWGPTTSTDPVGTIPTAPATLTSSFSLTLGGVPIQAQYAGLTPDSAGLYQVNFIVPPGIPAGNQPLVLTVDGVSTSPSAYIAIGN